jgi:hypothetical protein
MESGSYNTVQITEGNPDWTYFFTFGSEIEGTYGTISYVTPPYPSADDAWAALNHNNAVYG